MPPRSKIDLLPEAIRKELEKRLIGSGFSGYRDHAEWLASQGYEIRKSAVAEWGQSFEERMEMLRTSYAQARAVVDAAPDDEGAMNDALIRLGQHKLFGVLQESEEELPPKVLAAIMRAIADVGRTSISQKKWAAEVRAKGAAVIDEMAKAAGMGEEQNKYWMNRFLGIAEAKGA